MTTPTELIARGECDDLRREVEVLRRDLAARNAQVHRLNALFVKHEATIDAQEGIIEKLRGDLAAAKVNCLAIPY